MSRRQDVWKRQASIRLKRGESTLRTFSSPKMRRLLRREGKLVFRVIAYESPRGRAFGGGLVIPQKSVTYIPKTAISVMGTFFDARTGHTIAHEATKFPAESPERKSLLKSSSVVLKADTVRKMVFG